MCEDVCPAKYEFVSLTEKDACTMKDLQEITLF